MSPIRQLRRVAGSVAVLLLLMPSAGTAQRGGRGGADIPISPEAAADRIFAQFNSTHSPGCAVGVAQSGRTILMRGYGMANLETNSPITATTIFESGSVAKQFTSAAIAILMKDGKVNIDDPVRKYIPELPEYPQPLLVRHLLSHTSGLREWSNLVALAGWPRGTRVHSQPDLLEYITAQKSLNYPVGDFYSYTNSGFALLPTIIERVSGMSFVQFSEERIFRPLGLTNTHWRDDFRTIVPGRAQAYALRAGDSVGWELDMPFENVNGPGGLLTTVTDWLKWNEHLDKKTLGSNVVDSLTKQTMLTSGRTIAYARGLIVNTYRGINEIQHSGSTGGYSTFIARYPEKNLSIAVLCNAAGAPATQFTRGLVDALVPGLPQSSHPTRWRLIRRQRRNCWACIKAFARTTHSSSETLVAAAGVVARLCDRYVMAAGCSATIERCLNPAPTALRAGCVCSPPTTTRSRMRSWRPRRGRRQRSNSPRLPVATTPTKSTRRGPSRSRMAGSQLRFAAPCAPS